SRRCSLLCAPPRVNSSAAAWCFNAVIVDMMEPTNSAEARCPLSSVFYPLFKTLFPPCTRGKVAITVRALMGFSLGRTAAVTVCATLLVICACDRHQPGEYPEMQ